MRGTAARADLREFGSQASAQAAIDVTLGAASLGPIHLLTAFRISRDGLGSHAPQAANVRRKLPGLTSIQRVTTRHLGALYAIPDQHYHELRDGRIPQSRLPQH